MKEKLQSSQTEEERIISNVREHPFSDPQTQALYEKFIRASFSMTGEQHDVCMRLYAKHIAGVTIPDNWERDMSWANEVGRNLNIGGNSPENGVVFWQELQRAFPDYFSEEELKWLTEKDPKGGGGVVLMFHMARCPKSGLAPTIANYVHAWK